VAGASRAVGGGVLGGSPSAASPAPSSEFTSARMDGQRASGFASTARSVATAKGKGISGRMPRIEVSTSYAITPHAY
jgi:hypothetical protein